MTTKTEPPHDDDVEPTALPQAFWDRHAKLSILLIAGVFYVILFGMCASVAIILWLRQ